MKKTVSIVDVAKAAGVSPSTVSHAISGKRTISTDVKHRIFEKIRELDYRPNFFAQAMKSDATRLIGIVAEECRNPSTARLLDALTGELRRQNYDAMLMLGGLDLVKGRESLRRFSSGLVDGVINLLPQIDSEEAALLCGGVPVVTFLRSEKNLITLDFTGMTFAILEKFYSLGHRKIGYIASRTRLYRAADPAIAAIEIFAASHPELQVIAVYGDETAAGGETAMEQIMKQQPVTAVFAGNDETAFGIYHYAKKRSISIPESLSVIGFDDVPHAAVMSPPLTTGIFPTRELAILTVMQLLNKIKGSFPDDTARIIPLQLVERDSVASPGNK